VDYMNHLEFGFSFLNKFLNYFSLFGQN
jgi:hypothetical protein